MRLNETTYPAYITLEQGNYYQLKIDAMFGDKYIPTPSHLEHFITTISSLYKNVEGRYYLTSPFKDAILQSAEKLKDKLFDLDEATTGILFTDRGFTMYSWNPDSPNKLTAYGFTREVLTTYGTIDEEGKIRGVACSVKDGQAYDDQQGLIHWMLTILLAINFIKHCEIEVKILKPKEKYRSEGKKYFNESKSDVHILDCKWFTELIRDSPFKVRGHFRWQFHGEGRKGRKLIWIDEFQKEGYHRKAEKEVIN
jgi:hypothetical protein